MTENAARISGFLFQKKSMAWEDIGIDQGSHI